MEPDFILDYGHVITLRKKKGHKVIEFSRHPDPILDNIVEMWDYDSRKGSRGKSTWIILKDLPAFVNCYIGSGIYELLESETIPKKNNKKK